MEPIAKANSSSPSSFSVLGTVLVTGGCGFLGYHLVSRLLFDPDCCEHVYIIDRNISRNTHTHEKATYIKAAITEEKDLSTFLDRVNPAVIFHTASPNATYGRRGDFYHTNVEGTRTVLALARERSHVKALVYTSSLDVYATRHHNNLKETAPIWEGRRPWPWEGITEYDWTKALAHRLVLQANTDDGLKTAVIIPSYIYGLRDSQALSLMFDMFEDPGRPVFQVGKGDNMASFVEVGNCADAHILAAKALLSGVEGVPGQAFNVSDGEDIPLWWHTRLVCAAVREIDLNSASESRSPSEVVKMKYM
ncbi:Sterol-4-alpha-carboxylate 3-dehydrogenase, decarboxylating [Cytospora mali]|uniref:Sterol-4-alpha-carboxylate 3-dehydrogenase, decarboxylating n=1 Tax=Cytospora mali TaxID=578113 RepID=A0A194VEN6_CYTMA|nr:Sterol-4-alpha-carboxylate 3-dehydrogenase, decarboxylating [Valsa mali var. pyri (nom. inval.)]